MIIKIDRQETHINTKGFMVRVTSGFITVETGGQKSLESGTRLLPFPLEGMRRVESEFKINPTGTRCDFRLTDTYEPSDPRAGETDPTPIIVG